MRLGCEHTNEEHSLELLPKERESPTSTSDIVACVVRSEWDSNRTYKVNLSSSSSDPINGHLEPCDIIRFGITKYILFEDSLSRENPEFAARGRDTTKLLDPRQ